MAAPVNFVPPMPAGGYSFGPLDLPPVIPPEQQSLSPELPPLVEPIPVEAAFEPAPMVPVSGPVELDIGPATVKPLAPMNLRQETSAAGLPVVDMLGAQPAPVSGPDVEIAKGLDRQRNLGQARVAAEQDSATAAQDYRAAAEAWQAATTPAARAAAEKAAADAQQRMQGAQAVAQAAGLAQEREEAAQEATVSEAITAARTAKLAEVADVLNTRAAATQAKVDEAAAIRAKAQERRAAREQEYATVLERGPQDKTATWTSAIGMIGEMFSAYAQKRQPNFDVWLQRGLDMAREKHKGELDAIRARMGADEQAIDDASVEVATARADDLAFEQAILAKTDRDLQVLAARYAGTPQGMAAEQARRAVAAKQAIRASEAAAAAEKAQRERDMFDAELRNKRATAAIAERKAGAGGAGAGMAGTAGISDPTVVTLPGTNEVIARFPKTRTELKRAQAARDLVAAGAQTQRLLNEYKAMLEDYGERGLFDRKDFARSPELARLETARQAIVGPLAKVYAGGYNPSVAMEERAERNVALPAGWWQRKGVAEASVDELTRQAEEGFREGSAGVGLSAEAAERVIAFRRTRGESKRDRAKALIENAEKVISDIEQPLEKRIAAVQALPEKAKQEAQERGDEGDVWIPGAINKLKAALQAADSAEMEAAINAELKPLETMWRNKGEGATTRKDVERARARDIEFPRSIR